MLPPLLLLPALLVGTDPSRSCGAPPPDADYVHSAAYHAQAAATPMAPFAPQYAGDPRPGDMLITGRVMSEAGQALYGANVTIEALAISVGTDPLGTYRIIVPAAQRRRQAVLRARLFGYAPQVRSISFERDTLIADFALRTDVNRLSQVVVTGMAEGTEKAKAPFSIAQVSPNNPNATPNPNVLLRAPSTVGAGAGPLDPPRPYDIRRESYAAVRDNPFLAPRTEPLSTFSIDVDRASYSNVRRIITRNRARPPAEAVRLEEMINYFDYEYDAPLNAQPFAVHTDVARAPWAEDHLLVRIGLQGRGIDLSEAAPNNFVFLIDVSGSMSSPDKLPLLQHAFCLLATQMRPQDRVAIVTYAGAERLALPSTSGADRERIIRAIYGLHAGGSTAGERGIQLAYKIAKENFIPEGNNRVILATDGDFNVGVTSNAALERMIEEKRAEGTFLTVLGFGTGNIADDRMEMLADKGNGNYAYIDTRREAEKVFVREFGGTLVTIAKDVKIQVEFNPSVVAAYRLIGYENRLLETADFTNDRKDAGDIGAGHTVTALYEIIPVGTGDATRGAQLDSLRYVRPAVVRSDARDELLFVKLRYKQPTDSVSVPLEVAVANRVTDASTDFRFVQAVAAFGMLLRDSEHRGTASTEMVLTLASGALGADRFGYRREFIQIVEMYAALPGVVATGPKQ